MKKKDIEVILAIIFYVLAIAEEFLKLGIFSSIYSTVSQTTVFGFLLIVATGFIAVYLVQSMTKSKGMSVSFGRMRPNTNLEYAYNVNDYGVKWHLFEPDFQAREPWADGPYCPKCDRELVVVTKGARAKTNSFSGIWIGSNSLVTPKILSQF